ncbi:UDP-Gal or UDP-GlcNAc-dependent glycosyltransferase [Trypanosoma theileri]|uniref:Hexosyltransferase n=1 Tax=Trypanosoma theileri TaxID=67003 RepID=A0A1X0NIH4_9TRYP|nr:UDP-Gal or UDP-GlcNAc-dependent glycosyltransferase [Trypanosoma theileri]ORC84486.1 UDP-Gal or UDP-GlcNAc-dependent glycosyltransferase [Trypanosoma theileri]
MARKAPRRSVIYGTLLLFLLVVVFIGHYYLDADMVFQSSESHSNTPLAKNTSSRNTDSPDATMMKESLRYIPHSTIQTWRERDYLIVFGIPSVDIDSRRRRRDLQRNTCWQFPGVARRANNFTGAMLVLYVLARHPSQGYEYSAALLKEAALWHDIITLPMNDVLPSTNKTVAGKGHWGIAAEITMSRKTFLWFDLSIRLSLNTSYIAKGDDDMFLRVPQFLSDLRLLPLKGIYWGVPIPARVTKGNTELRFRYAAGACYTLSRDVAEHFVSYEPLKRLVHLSYSKEREEEFVSLNMDAEDVMVARVLFVESRYTPLIYVNELPCRFQNIYNGAGEFTVNPKSVFIHHLQEGEYAMLMDRFGNGTTYRPRVRILPKRRVIKFLC